MRARNMMARNTINQFLDRDIKFLEGYETEGDSRIKREILDRIELCRLQKINAVDLIIEGYSSHKANDTSILNDINKLTNYISKFKEPYKFHIKINNECCTSDGLNIIYILLEGDYFIKEWGVYEGNEYYVIKIEMNKVVN